MEKINYIHVPFSIYLPSVCTKGDTCLFPSSAGLLALSGWRWLLQRYWQQGSSFDAIFIIHLIEGSDVYLQISHLWRMTKDILLSTHSAGARRVFAILYQNLTNYYSFKIKKYTCSSNLSICSPLNFTNRIIPQMHRIIVLFIHVKSKVKTKFHWQL